MGSEMCIRDREKAPWRVSKRDNLPSSPSMASRNEVWNAEGVSTFSVGVLVRGHGIHSSDIIIFTRTSYCIYSYPVIYTQDSRFLFCIDDTGFFRLPAADTRTYIRTRYQYHSSTFSSMYQYVMCGMYIVQQYNTAFKKKLAVRVIRVQHR